MSRWVYGPSARFAADENLVGSIITSTIQGGRICYCDKQRVEQVLAQLITNAISFSQKIMQRSKSH